MRLEDLSHSVCVCVCVRVCVCDQSCLTLHNPINCSPPGSSGHAIFQARILEWTAVSSSRGSPHISWVSCIIRQILYQCATWEPHDKIVKKNKKT